MRAGGADSWRAGSAVQHRRRSGGLTPGDLISTGTQPGDHPFRLVGGAEFAAGERPVDTRIGERHDTSCVIYTSGTTGPPKGVIIPWGSMNQPPGYLPARIEPGGSRYSFL